MTIASTAQRLLGHVDRTVSAASGGALLIVTLTIFANAAGRYTAGISFLGGEELARLLTIWITFLAAYSMLRHDRHVTIDLLLRFVPPGIERLLRGIVALIGVATMAYLSVMAWQLCAFSFGTGQTGTTLPVPRGLFYLPVFVGAVLMCVAFIEKVVRAIANTLPPLPALVETDETADDSSQNDRSS